MGLGLGHFDRHFRLVYWRLFVAFQWFLVEFSVLPGSFFAISDHLFPTSACAAISIRSSSSVQKSFCYLVYHLIKYVTNVWAVWRFGFAVSSFELIFFFKIVDLY
uniref:Uncharacterized protein n=1 Tax=Helianthus annuus TaxID=4232 RepID=A0A251USU7_HELAN